MYIIVSSLIGMTVLLLLLALKINSDCILRLTARREIYGWMNAPVLEASSSIDLTL